MSSHKQNEAVPITIHVKPITKAGIDSESTNNEKLSHTKTYITTNPAHTPAGAPTTAQNRAPDEANTRARSPVSDGDPNTDHKQVPDEDLIVHDLVPNGKPTTAEIGVQTTDLTFDQAVRILMILRRWLPKFRAKKKKQNAGKKNNDDNVIAVFGGNIEDVVVDDGRSTLGKILHFSLDETGWTFYNWTTLVTLGCVYNMVTIAVLVFDEVHKNYYKEWIFTNIFFDCVFFIDIFVMSRIEIIIDGVRVRTVRGMAEHRIRNVEFLHDLICIIPFDLLLLLKTDLSLLRFNRLLKCYRLYQWSLLSEMRATFPHLFRLLKLIFLCYMIFHWNGCIYFFLSIFYDFESATIDDWIFSWDKIPDPIFVSCDQWTGEEDCDTTVSHSLRHISEWHNSTEEIEDEMEYWINRSQAIPFSNFTKQYGLSFYWSALTLVTLGEQPWPGQTFQFMFETCDTLLGLVIFATIVGDVGNMVTTMNLIRSNFEDMLDGCKSYMTKRKVPEMLQGKVVHYLGFMWSEGKMNVDEKAIADFMPPRLYGQLAVHIHMVTLRRVKLFEDCEPALLYELILRLEPQMYSAGDYICRKGEVGKEMYIVKSGFVEVVSEDGTKVFVRLGEGTVFGELSILNIAGNKNGNRRTANVRSVGYCDLYTLQKDHLWDALIDYPHAKESLMEKGRALLAKDNLLEEVEENPLDFEGHLPLETLLANAKRALDLIHERLDDAERSFKEQSARAKQRVHALEQEFEHMDEWEWNSEDDDDEGDDSVFERDDGCGEGTLSVAEESHSIVHVAEICEE